MSRSKATLVAAAAALTAGSASAAAESLATQYTLAATKRCLVSRGAKVGAVKPRDARLRQLHDLAQKNSLEANFKSGRVGFAVSKSESDARLLAELLAVPRDPYRLVRKANVVLMYRPAHRKAYTLTVACLRPAA